MVDLRDSGASGGLGVEGGPGLPDTKEKGPGCCCEGHPGKEAILSAKPAAGAGRRLARACSGRRGTELPDLGPLGEGSVVVGKQVLKMASNETIIFAFPKSQSRGSSGWVWRSHWRILLCPASKPFLAQAVPFASVPPNPQPLQPQTTCGVLSAFFSCPLWGQGMGLIHPLPPGPHIVLGT